MKARLETIPVENRGIEIESESEEEYSVLHNIWCTHGGPASIERKEGGPIVLVITPAKWFDIEPQEVPQEQGLVHELKIEPQRFDDVGTGKKLFEYRKHDRPFAVGDFLKLREWDPGIKDYTGRVMVVSITYVLDKCPGMPSDYCILGIRR